MLTCRRTVIASVVDASEQANNNNDSKSVHKVHDSAGEWPRQVHSQPVGSQLVGERRASSRRDLQPVDTTAFHADDQLVARVADAAGPLGDIGIFSAATKSITCVRVFLYPSLAYRGCLPFCRSQRRLSSKPLEPARKSIGQQKRRAPSRAPGEGVPLGAAPLRAPEWSS